MKETSKPQCEETVAHKNFIKGINKVKGLIQNNLIMHQRTNSCESLIYPNNKVNQNVRIIKKSKLEIDCVGEEGTAQIIRSPIVKRKKSSATSVDIANLDEFMGNNKKLEEIQGELHKIKLENASIKTESQILRSQIQILKNIIADLNKRLEDSKVETNQLISRINGIMHENSRILQENEKLMNRMTRDNERSYSSIKLYLQDDLEQKILSLDHEKEEKNELYQQVLMKYLSCLNEFSSSEEWILSLINSISPVTELKDCENLIKERLQRISMEIINCQSQMSAEKLVEKSYFTSISSSMIPSPLNSPNRTLRFTNTNDFTEETKGIQ